MVFMNSTILTLELSKEQSYDEKSEYFHFSVNIIIIKHRYWATIMILKDISIIKGLRYIPNFITKSQKQTILSIINSHPWCNRLRR